MVSGGSAAHATDLPHGETMTLDLVDLGPEGDRQGASHDAPRGRLGDV